MSEILVDESGSLTYQIDPLITAVTITINPEIVVPPMTHPSKYSQKVKTGGDRVFKEVGFTITGLTTSTGFVQSAPVYGSIPGSTIKTKADGDSLVVETDTAVPIAVPGNIGPTPALYVITIIINDAGQTKAKAA